MAQQHDAIGVGGDALPLSGLMLPSVSRIATNTTDDIGLTGGNGLIVVIDTSVVPAAAPSTVFSIVGVIYPDGPGGAAVTFPLLTSAAVVAVNTKTAPLVLQVNPSGLAVANLVAQALVPDKIRIVATHGNANPVTYSVTAILVD